MYGMCRPLEEVSYKRSVCRPLEEESSFCLGLSTRPDSEIVIRVITVSANLTAS